MDAAAEVCSFSDPQLIIELSEDRVNLKAHLDRAIEQTRVRELELEELMKTKVEESRALLLHEFESERAHHQKLVKDHTRLQQRYENLQGDVRILASPPGGGGGGPGHRGVGGAEGGGAASEAHALVGGILLNDF